MFVIAEWNELAEFTQVQAGVDNAAVTYLIGMHLWETYERVLKQRRNNQDWNCLV
jgi:hypothetical protein